MAASATDGSKLSTSPASGRDDWELINDEDVSPCTKCFICFYFPCGLPPVYSSAARAQRQTNVCVYIIDCSILQASRPHTHH
jgi:hypothetical protein